MKKRGLFMLVCFFPSLFFMQSTDLFIDYLDLNSLDRSDASDTEECALPIISCFEFMCTKLLNRPKYSGLS